MIVVTVPRIVAPVAAGLPIFDFFNKADGSPFNPCSDGGSWTQFSRDTSRPSSDPFVYPVNTAMVIESNRGRLSYIDPVSGGFVTGYIARLIPTAPAAYEFSIDIFRNRAGGSDQGVTLHLMINPPVGQVSQNAPGYRFEFSQYAGSTRIVNTTGAISPTTSAYGPWPQGETRRLTVRRQGAVLTMLVNNAAVLTWTDPAPPAESHWCYIPNQDYFDRVDNFKGGLVGTTF